MPSPPVSHDNWPEHIVMWRASKLTRAEYCRQHDLKLHTFIYRIKRQHAPAKSLTLVPVTVRAAPENGDLVLRGPNGWSLAMAGSVSPVWLAQLLGGLS